MKSSREKPMAQAGARDASALALLAGAALPAWSQNAIQSINSSQQAGAEVVRIEMSEPLDGGAGRLHDPGAAAHRARPARRRATASARSSVEINQGNLRSVNVAQAGDRTRLVLNLKAPAGYQRDDRRARSLLVLARAQRAGDRWRSVERRRRRASPRA